MAVSFWLICQLGGQFRVDVWLRFDIARESIHVCGTMGRKIPAWTNSSKAHEGLCTSLESWGARYWLRGAMWCRHVCYILARTLVAVQIRAPV